MFNGRGLLMGLPLLLLLGCGGGNTPPAPPPIVLTAFFPGTPLPSDAATAFTLFGGGFLAAGDPVGAVATVRFRATTGTPFSDGTSETLETTGVIVSGDQIVGVVPAASIPAGAGGPLPATVEVVLLIGGAAASSGPLAQFARLQPEITDFLPGTPIVGRAAVPFTVFGSGLGPVGGTAQVTFTALAGSFCGRGTSVTVEGVITSSSSITGTTPGTGVSDDLGALVSVTLPVGPTLTGLVFASFLGAPGTGNFVDTLAGLGADHPTTVSLGDVNGDGHLDAIVANGGGGTATDVAVFVNDGAGTLVPAGSFSNDNAAHRAALGDLDGDGDLDSVVVYYASASPNVYRNNGAGAFTSFGASLGSLPALCVTLADVDGDEDLDVLMGMDSGGGNRVFVNDGSASFAPGGTFPTAQATWALVTADVDGDLDLDVFAADGGGVVLFMNDGAGAFSASTEVFASSGLVQALLAGDVDGDGDPDVVVVHRSGGTRVYLNSGAGAFSDSGQLLGDTNPLGAQAFAGALGDVDGDCDLDLVFGNAGSVGPFPPASDGRTTVWRNDGAGAFADSGQRLGTPVGLTLSVALGDLNGDGDLDLVTGDGGGFDLSVFSNP